DRQADAVLHAIAAPRRAHAGFHRAQCFAVGVPRLEAGRDQLRPDEGQLVQACAEKIDALAARDLGVEPEAARHFADDDQLLGCDFASWYAGHDGVRAILLHVGEKVIVGVLQRGTVAGEHELVPTGSENGCDGGLADVAAESPAVLREQPVEGPDAGGANEMEELLPGVVEVLAEVIFERDAAAPELDVENLLDERRAAAAGARGPGARLDRAHRGAAACDRRADGSLGDVVAGAYRSGIRQRGETGARGATAGIPRRKNQV